MSVSLLSDLHVSMHALVRWVERVEEIDTAPYRKELRITDDARNDRRLLDHMEASGVIAVAALKVKILGDDIREAARLGMTQWKRGEVTFLLRDHRVLTVFGPGQKVNRHRPHAVKKLRKDQDRHDAEHRRKRIKWGRK